MARYGSDVLRNKNLQKKAINYGLKNSLPKMLDTELLINCQQKLGQNLNIKLIERIWMWAQ